MCWLLAHNGIALSPSFLLCGLQGITPDLCQGEVRITHLSQMSPAGHRCVGDAGRPIASFTGHPQWADDTSQPWVPGETSAWHSSWPWHIPPECCSLLCLFPWILRSLLLSSPPSALCSLGALWCILCLRSVGAQFVSSCPGQLWEHLDTCAQSGEAGPCSGTGFGGG